MSCENPAAVYTGGRRKVCTRQYARTLRSDPWTHPPPPRQRAFWVTPPQISSKPRLEWNMSSPSKHALLSSHLCICKRVQLPPVALYMLWCDCLLLSTQSIQSPCMACMHCACAARDMYCMCACCHFDDQPRQLSLARACSGGV
jgi:hypothetical protein